MRDILDLDPCRAAWRLYSCWNSPTARQRNSCEHCRESLYTKSQAPASCRKLIQWSVLRASTANITTITTGPQIKVYKYLKSFNNVTARGLCDCNNRTRNNGVKLIVKRFKHINSSTFPHHQVIKITITWNTLPSDITSSRTVNTFKNRFDQHWELNPPNVRTVF